ncbi:hypothetical protein [Oleispirillum naphthae]|uniref:hypothetical protein n=1 Tax=Oleispirillum naphthae TaxID=2838853 RepID=UPI0030826445
MDTAFLRIIMLGAGLLLGFGLMGCSGQDLAASPKSESGATVPPVASFAQFSDIPVPSGASMDMDRSLLLGASEAWTGRLVYSTSTDPAQVFDLYKAEMPKFGWTELTVIRGERSIMSYQRGSRVSTIEIQKSRFYGASVSVTVSPNTGTGGSSSYGGAPSGGVSRSPLR